MQSVLKKHKQYISSCGATVMMILKGLLYLAWFVFEQSKGMFLLNIDFRKFIQQTISRILTNIVIQSSYHCLCLIKFDLLILTTNLHIRKSSIYFLFSMHYIYTILSTIKIRINILRKNCTDTPEWKFILHKNEK